VGALGAAAVNYAFIEHFQDVARGHFTVRRLDVMVRCGPPSANTFVTDPVVVVEVLSNSTVDLDCGRKLQFYKRLPTVQHIVLTHADQMRVEHYFRTESGWDCKVLSVSDSVLELAAVDFRMDLRSVYFDVHF